MTTTTRFGLTREALLAHDVTVVDAILAALELHEHRGGERLVDPALPLTGVVSDTGGQLPAGTTFYYREAWVDQYGLETAAGPEYSATTTPAASAPPAPAVVMVAGGTLGTGPTYWALSAFVGTQETQLGAPALVTVTTGLTTAEITAPAFPATVTKYGVWRQGSLDLGFTRIGEITDPDDAFVDDGSVVSDCSCDPSQLPPAVNLTNATSKVTLTSSDEDFVGADPSLVLAWRIYRTVQSGVYGASSLLVESRTTVDVDGGGLVTEFVDDGTIPLSSGTPQEQSQTLTPSTVIAGGGGSALLLLSPDDTSWRVVTDENGALVTRTSATSPEAGTGVFLLSDPGLVSWELTIGNDGALATVVGTAGSTDTVYLSGGGPVLPSPDATVEYQLSVADDGALITTEV